MSKHHHERHDEDSELMTATLATLVFSAKTSSSCN